MSNSVLKAPIKLNNLHNLENTLDRIIDKINYLKENETLLNLVMDKEA